MKLKIYKSKNQNIKQLMVDVQDQTNIVELEGAWVKVDDVKKLIKDKIKYLESNELYPAYGLNSQVESLKQLYDWFEIDTYLRK